MARRLRLPYVAVQAALAASIAAALGCSTSSDPVAMRWLDQNCAAGEGDRAETELRSEGPRAEATLIWAYEHGPARDAIDDDATEAALRYGEIVAALGAGRFHGLSRAAVGSVRAISRPEYVRRARSIFERSYRADALSGLGVLGLPRGMELLRHIAADPRSPDHETAVEVLRGASPPPAGR